MENDTTYSCVIELPCGHFGAITTPEIDAVPTDEQIMAHECVRCAIDKTYEQLRADPRMRDKTDQDVKFIAGDIHGYWEPTGDV